MLLVILDDMGVARSGRPRASSSPPWAPRRSGRSCPADPPRPDELTNVIGAVQDRLDDVLRELPDAIDATVAVRGSASLPSPTSRSARRRRSR